MRTTNLADDEPDRWRQWLDRHGPALVLFARQWSATRADAEDAVQSGFLRFWRTRETAREPLPYLYACVRTAAMDLGRSERRRNVRDRHASEANEEDSAFQFPVERREREAAIEAALNQLPGDQREVVVMKIWGGLTFAEIGAALGVPLSTAASRYRYALTRLAQELSEEMAS
jgi:RNA polymerase sigma-70 factor (ECF subfamily)